MMVQLGDYWTLFCPGAEQATTDYFNKTLVTVGFRVSLIET